MNRLKQSLTIFLLAAMAGCIYYRSINHSPIMAAMSASEFAQVALVKGNADKAFNMLHPDFQANSTREMFARQLTEINSPTAPLSIRATDYEPAQGGEGMYIYFTGESDRQTFYYRILMKGNKQKGYKPMGLFRNPNPYPKSSSRHPL